MTPYDGPSVQTVSAVGPDSFPVLAEAASVGPYFTTSKWAADEGWRPLSELFDGCGALDDRVEHAQRVLEMMSGSSVECRVAASTVHLGLAARLLSAPLATAVVAGVLPDWSVATLWWQPVPGGPMPLAADSTPTVAASAATFHEVVVSGLLSPLSAEFEHRFHVSDRVLWGNVASGLGGAAKMLRIARPEDGEAAFAFRDAVLGMGRLDGTVDDLGVRRSCCLYYRVPGGGYCGDCALVTVSR
jgi:hypothetical protein